MSDLVADAYDEYYDDDDYEEGNEEEEEDTEATPESMQQYMWNNTESTSSEQPSSVTHGKGEGAKQVLDVLVKDIREILQNNSLSRERIDHALQQAKYNPEQAIAALLDEQSGREEEGKSAAKNQQNPGNTLESTTPSQMGQVIASDSAEEADEDHADTRTAPAVSGLSQPTAVKPFMFDEPSPDDLISTQKRSGKTRTGEFSLPPLYEPKDPKIPTSSDDIIREQKLESKQHMPTFSSTALRFTGLPSDTEMPTVSLVDDSRRNVPRRPQALGSRETSGASTLETIQKGMNNLSIPKRAIKKKRNKSTPQSSRDKKLNVKQRVKSVPIPRIQDSKTGSCGVVFVGHVDAGKSTIIGQLLQNMKGATKKRKRRLNNLAWVTDEDATERERGVTIDISTKTLQLPGGRRLAIIDAPGHRDFVPAMMLGVSQAHAGLLVVDASPGEFEAGFSTQGQTREHAVLLHAHGIRQLVVVVNKMDTCQFSKGRFAEVRNVLAEFLMTMRYHEGSNLLFVPCSATTKVNLFQKPSKSHPLAAWYNGLTVLNALEIFANFSRPQEVLRVKPTRFVVAHSFRSKASGGSITLTGNMISGTIAVKDSLLILPARDIAKVKSIEVHGEGKNVVIAGVNNEPISMTVQVPPEMEVIDPGSVLCDPEKPANIHSVFRPHVIVLDVDRPIMHGSKVMLHTGSGAYAATVSKLVALTNKSATGDIKLLRRPRRLTTGQAALIEIKTPRPICVEKYVNVPALGRITLRDRGRTIAVGIVVEIDEQEGHVNYEDLFLALNLPQ